MTLNMVIVTISTAAFPFWNDDLNSNCSTFKEDRQTTDRKRHG